MPLAYPVGPGPGLPKSEVQIPSLNYSPVQDLTAIIPTPARMPEHFPGEKCPNVLTLSPIDPGQLYAVLNNG